MMTFGVASHSSEDIGRRPLANAPDATQTLPLQGDRSGASSMRFRAKLDIQWLNRLLIILCMAACFAVVGLAGTTDTRASTPTTLSHIDNNADLKTVTGSPTTLPVIVRDAFATPNDGGLATYGWSTANCTIPGGDDGSQVQPTGVTGCWILQRPIPADVRIWGAQCDVTAVHHTNGKDTYWDPTKTAHGAGALVVDNLLLTPPPRTSGQYISISQLGTPTLYGTFTPAVTATRWTTLSSTGSNYAPGDLLSFIGTGAVTSLSQQMAIIVDGVDAGGAIQQWHFLWGGLYSASAPPPPPLLAWISQTPGHSGCLMA